jgi:hypothetical protein
MNVRAPQEQEEDYAPQGEKKRKNVQGCGQRKAAVLSINDEC